MTKLSFCHTTRSIKLGRLAVYLAHLPINFSFSVDAPSHSHMHRNEIYETAQLGRDEAVRRPQHTKMDGAGYLLGQHGLQCPGLKGLRGGLSDGIVRFDHRICFTKPYLGCDNLIPVVHGC